MATSKTLTPTNVTISIPEMTDQPDTSVLANCVDKTADAVNALNTNLANKADYHNLRKQGDYTICSTDSDIETAVANHVALMGETQSSIIGILVANLGMKLANGYHNGIVFRYDNNNYSCLFYTSASDDLVKYRYAGGVKTWNSYALNSNLTPLLLTGTVSSRLALLETSSDSYTIPSTGMYKFNFYDGGGQLKSNGILLFDNNVNVQIAVPFKVGTVLTWSPSGSGKCGIYALS